MDIFGGDTCRSCGKKTREREYREILIWRTKKITGEEKKEPRCHKQRLKNLGQGKWVGITPIELTKTKGGGGGGGPCERGKKIPPSHFKLCRWT